MLVGPNMASTAFRTHFVMYCQLGERKVTLSVQGRGRNCAIELIRGIWQFTEQKVIVVGV